MVESFLSKIFSFKCCEDIDQTLKKDKKEILIQDNVINEYNSNEAINENEIQIESKIENLNLKCSNIKTENINENEVKIYELLEKNNSLKLNALNDQFKKLNSFDLLKSSDSQNKISSKTDTNEELNKIFTNDSKINNIESGGTLIFSDTSMYNILFKETSKRIIAENMKLFNENVPNRYSLKSSFSKESKSEIIMKIHNLKGNFLKDNKTILINKYGLMNNKVKYFGFTVFGFKIENSKQDKKHLHYKVLNNNKEKNFDKYINSVNNDFENSLNSSINPFQLCNNSFGSFVDVLLEKNNKISNLSNISNSKDKISKESFFQFFFIFFNTGKLKIIIVYNCYELRLFPNVMKIFKLNSIKNQILYKVESYNLNLGIDHLSKNNTCNTIFIGNSKIKICIEHLKQINKFRNSFQNTNFDEKSNVSSCFDDTVDDKFVLKIYIFDINLDEKEKENEKVKQIYEFDADTDLYTSSKFPLYIGKKNCHIIIENDKEISSKHFKIEYDHINKIFSIHDEKSKNGTWLLIENSLLFKYKEKEKSKIVKTNIKIDGINHISKNGKNSINRGLIKFDDKHIVFELEKIIQ